MKSGHVKHFIKEFEKDFGKLSSKEKTEFWDFLFYNYDVPVIKKPPKDKHQIVFSYKIGAAKSKKGSDSMLDLTITNDQKITVTLKPNTGGASPKPAKVDGIPTWTVQSGDSAVSVAEDGLSAALISSDTPGDSTYLVEADADLGAGIETISDTITLHVVGANATSLGLTAGTAEAKP